MVAHLQHQAARLAAVEKAIHEGGVGEGGGGGGGGGGSVSAESIREGAQEIVEAAFDELAGRINAVESQQAKARQPDAEDLAYFRNKTEEMETVVADLKRLLLKVQSFAMETNCAMLKLGARVEATETEAHRRQRQEEATAQAGEIARERWQSGVEAKIDAAVEARIGAVGGTDAVSVDEADEADEEEVVPAEEESGVEGDAEA